MVGVCGFSLGMVLYQPLLMTNKAFFSHHKKFS